MPAPAPAVNGAMAEKLWIGIPNAFATGAFEPVPEPRADNPNELATAP